MSNQASRLHIPFVFAARRRPSNVPHARHQRVLWVLSAGRPRSATMPPDNGEFDFFPFDDMRVELSGSTKERTAANGNTRKTLGELGLRVDLGHAGLQCPSLTPGDVRVFTHAGIFQVMLNFCGCNNAPIADGQMREMGWLPGGPGTYATRELLQFSSRSIVF